MVKPTWNFSHINSESELTDLSSDEEEVDQLQESSGPTKSLQRTSSTSETPRATRISTQEATQKSKARNKDKWPLPAVKIPRSTTLSVSNLYDLIKQGKVELNPEYQRGIVWNETKQSNFINSLYHRFHAPAIVFNVTEDQDTGDMSWTCMDGKQRLTSICNFFDGKIPLMPYLNAEDAPGYARRKFWSQTNGTTRPLVLRHVMDNLKTTAIACVEYSDLSPKLEREIFQRVQHGVPLTPSDRLPAINGPWADLVRELRNRVNTTEGFEGYLDWGEARGKDFQALAQIIYLVINGSSPKKAYPSPQRIESFLHSTDGKPSSVKSAIINTMDIFCRIASTPSISDPLTTDLAPLEFVMAGFLIYQQRSFLTVHQLSDAISKMREHAKGRIEDLRLSQPNFKVFLDFVLKNLPKFVNQLATAEEKERPAALMPYKRKAIEVDRFKYDLNLNTDVTGAKANGKRKGTMGDGDGDDDTAWIVEAPTKKKPKVFPSQSTAKVDFLAKAVNRQTEAESKARTVVKKSTQKATTKATTNSPAVKAPSRSKLPSKVDDQIGRPTVRPMLAMAGRPPVPTRIGDVQNQKAKDAVYGSPPNSSRSLQSRVSTPYDPQRPKAVGAVISPTTSGNLGSLLDRVSHNPPNVGMAAPSSQLVSPAASYLNWRYDTSGNRVSPTSDPRQIRDRVTPSVIPKNITR